MADWLRRNRSELLHEIEESRSAKKALALRDRFQTAIPLHFQERIEVGVCGSKHQLLFTTYLCAYDKARGLKRYIIV